MKAYTVNGSKSTDGIAVVEDGNCVEIGNEVLDLTPDATRSVREGRINDVWILHRDEHCFLGVPRDEQRKREGAIVLWNITGVVTGVNAYGGSFVHKRTDYRNGKKGTGTYLLMVMYPGSSVVVHRENHRRVVLNLRRNGKLNGYFVDEAKAA